MDEHRADVRIGFRSGWVRYLNIAIGGMGVLAIALEGFRIIAAQPRAGIDLLTAWGPWPFIVLVVVASAGHFLNGVGESIKVTFGAMVKNSQQSAEAQKQMADAVTRLAEQSGRQQEEIQRLAIYAGRELGTIGERMDRQDSLMKDVASAVRGLHSRLDEKRG